MWIHVQHGFRSLDSVFDVDWCCNDSLTAPLFARLHQLHSFKQRVPSHLEHCPNSMDSTINTATPSRAPCHCCWLTTFCWWILIVVDLWSPWSHGSLLWLLAYSNHHSTSVIVSQIDLHMHSQAHSFCSMSVHWNNFHSCGTPSILRVPLLLFQQIGDNTHRPTHGPQRMDCSLETHSFFSYHMSLLLSLQSTHAFLLHMATHTVSHSIHPTHGWHILFLHQRLMPHQQHMPASAHSQNSSSLTRHRQHMLASATDAGILLLLLACLQMRSLSSSEDPTNRSFLLSSLSASSKLKPVFTLINSSCVAKHAIPFTSMEWPRHIHFVLHCHQVAINLFFKPFSACCSRMFLRIFTSISTQPIILLIDCHRSSFLCFHWRTATNPSWSPFTRLAVKTSNKWCDPAPGDRAPTKGWWSMGQFVRNHKHLQCC